MYFVLLVGITYLYRLLVEKLSCSRTSRCCCSYAWRLSGVIKELINQETCYWVRFRQLRRRTHSHNLWLLLVLSYLMTMWEPCLFRGKPPVPLKKVPKRKIWFFTERDWNQGCCHGNNIVGLILFVSGAKFEDYCFNISRNILDWVSYCFSGTIYDVITFLICIIQRREYL